MADSPREPRQAGLGASFPKLAGLGALYFAQGIPLGIAAEYLPVALRQSHASYSLITAVSWLQLPWTLKVLWARAGDTPALRTRARRVVLVLQLCLAATIALYTLRPLAEGRALWFTLTAIAALFASTQDVFVDGLAVRTLGPQERGLGNVAQVGAYRLGMVAGGAGLLSLGFLLSERIALLGLAALVALAAAGTLFVGERPQALEALDLREAKKPRASVAQAGSAAPEVQAGSAAPEAHGTWRALVSMVRPEVRTVLVVAFTFKLGLHTAAALLKPVLVDGGWSKERIGTLAVTVGTLAGVLGSVAGGLAHRLLGDRRALSLAAVLQAIACVPLFFVVGRTSQIAWVTTALAVEHAASGLGTTVLFAALMGATNPKNASLEFTVLSTANAVSLATAGALGAAIADLANAQAAFAVGATLSLAALVFLPRWDGASKTLREGTGVERESGAALG